MPLPSTRNRRPPPRRRLHAAHPPMPSRALPPAPHVPLLRGVAAVLLLPHVAPANPAGMTVQSGSATAAQNGGHLQVTASHNAFLNWQGFNIAPGERTQFIQPSASSVVWNRIHDANPSQIHGQLDANGIVVLMNPAGFHFGPGSFVSAAGLVVSTAPAAPLESSSGLFWQFNGAPPEASIVNYGRIETTAGGSAFLIARQIENRGSIEAPGGTIGLAAGQEVLLSDRPDGRGLSATVRLPEGAIDNQGRLTADAGIISLHARVVNQGGQIQANTVRERSGIIELVASDNLTLPTGASITAASDGTSPGGALTASSGANLTVAGTINGPSRIHLAATRNLSIASGVALDVTSPGPAPGTPPSLHLEAGGNLTLASGSSVTARDAATLRLEAGRDLATPDTLVPGTGNVALNGSATVQSDAGNITLRAGNNITVSSGAVRTVAGGSIQAQAVAGSINTGTRSQGFRFLPTAYAVDPELGGISTAAGGNVELSAGLDVTSLLPLPGGTQSNPGSGAFGPEPGNVSVTAGRDVAGHFVVRNGEGAVRAGRDAGTSARLLALSLVDGRWSVEAARDLLLQEIRNPNGIFNNLGSTTSPNRHRFDYSDSAAAVLRAGNSVQLRGSALPRYSDVFSQGMPPIYPGSLEIHAGAGGVVLGHDVIVFPSPLGQLAIHTSDGGSLVGTRPGDLTQLVLSNSGKRQYRAFGDFGISDHGPNLLHSAASQPVQLAIAGDLRGVLIGSPKQTRITVGGNMVNSRFDGQNLHDSDVTRIDVAGDILNRNEFTSVPVAGPPDFSAIDLDLVYPPPSGGIAGIESRFAYNATTRTLTFQGRMTGEQLQFLLAAPVRVFDAAGNPVLLPSGEPLTQPVSLLDPTVARNLYDASQDIPLNPDTGYRLGGGGRFEISARNLDLGATAGIVSQGPRANPALATRFTRGADIDLQLAGNLDMFSTRIASINGGDIQITAQGDIRAGSRDFSSADAAARGIYTVDPSDITVIARGDKIGRASCRERV